MWTKHAFLALAASLMALPAWGQPVPSREPSSTHIFPAGGRRGTTVKVRVGGECFPPGMGLRLFGDGVTGPAVLGSEVRPRYEPSADRLPRDGDAAGAAMSYPREWDATLTLAVDAELGPRYWRATGGWGGTQLRPFLVGDLPEHIESESNSQPERAERVTLPVVLNGQIAGERDQDFYVFTAKAGEVLVCDVMAARIGSPLEPVLTITDARGQRVDTEEARAGNDSVVAFRVPADGDYRLHVANLGYRGGPAYVYRITVSNRPHALFAFPPGGSAGETRELDVYTLTGTGTPRVVKQQVTFPAAVGPFRHGASLSLIAGDLPEVTEKGNNHTAETAMELTLPVTVNARFLSADEEDWFRFTAKKDEELTITCQPFPHDWEAVPVLTLVDETGKPLVKAATVDHNDHRRDIHWKSPADGVYRLRLLDLRHGARGGPELIYRLTVRLAQPDFSLVLLGDNVNVLQGGKTEVGLRLYPMGGFHAPVELIVDGLPEGVKVEPTRFTSADKLIFTASDDARPTDAVLRVRARATVGGKVIERTAVSWGPEWRQNHLCLTVQHKPVVRLTCGEAYQYAHRGSIYPYLMKLERLNGFTGEVVLQLCDRQVQDLDGLDFVEQVIPAGATEVHNRIHFPETMHAGAQHHSRPYAQAYATFTDKWGQKQTLLTVSDKRCMVRTLPPVVKLRAVRDSLVARPGEEVECRLVLERTPNFSGAMQVELVGTPSSRTQIEEGQKEVVVRVRIGEARTLRFRATGKLGEDATAVSEATVAVTSE